MANEENLIPVRTKNEARELGQRGGIASGEARRAKKTMKEMLDYLLEKEIENSRTGEKVTYREAILTSCIKKAIKGDVKAAQFVRDTAGETPITKTELTGKNGLPLVQKVFVSKKDTEEIDKKIDGLIDG
jgi:hypothetical protein